MYRQIIWKPDLQIMKTTLHICWNYWIRITFPGTELSYARTQPCKRGWMPDLENMYRKKQPLIMLHTLQKLSKRRETMLCERNSWDMGCGMIT